MLGVHAQRRFCRCTRKDASTPVFCVTRWIARTLGVVAIGSLLSFLLCCSGDYWCEKPAGAQHDTAERRARMNRATSERAHVTLAADP
jgi:hypothetical protein